MQKPTFNTNLVPFTYKWYQSLFTFMFVLKGTEISFDALESIMRIVRFFAPYTLMIIIQWVLALLIIGTSLLLASILRPIVWRFSIGVIIGAIVYVKELIPYLWSKRHEEHTFDQMENENPNAHDAFTKQIAARKQEEKDKPKTMKDVFGG